MQQSSVNNKHLSEQDAELDALTVLVYANINDCLEAFGLPVSIEVVTAKGVTITIYGRELFDKKRWKTFLKQTQTPESYQLAGVVEALAKRYVEWLVTKHTPRYRAITVEADLAWLQCVAVLAVKRHMMEQKYEVFLTQQRMTFAEPLLIASIAVIKAYHQMVKESARVAHHIIKDPEQAQLLLKQLHETFRRLVPERAIAKHSLALPPASNFGQEEAR